MRKTRRGKAFGIGMVVSGKQGNLFLHRSYKAWMACNSMAQLLRSAHVLHRLLVCAVFEKTLWPLIFFFF